MTCHTCKSLQDLGVSIGHVEVFLDGKKQERVVSFDEDEGWVARYQRDEHGGALVRDDEFVEERLYGDVQAWLTWGNRIGSGGGAVPYWPHAMPAPEPSRTRVRVRSILESQPSAQPASTRAPHAPAPQAFWLVWRENGGPPTVRHDSHEAALAEAKRLAEKCPGEVFLVLETIASVTKPIAATVVRPHVGGSGIPF